MKLTLLITLFSLLTAHAAAKSYSKAQLQARSYCGYQFKEVNKDVAPLLQMIEKEGLKTGRTAECPTCWKFDVKKCIQKAFRYCMDDPRYLSKRAESKKHYWMQDHDKNHKSKTLYAYKMKFEKCRTEFARSILGK